MNLVETEFASHAGRPVFRCGSELKIPVPPHIAVALEKRKDKRFVLAIRPEHFELLDEPQELAFPGTVSMVELLGKDKLIDFRFGEVALRVLGTCRSRDQPRGEEVDSSQPQPHPSV